MREAYSKPTIKAGVLIPFNLANFFLSALCLPFFLCQSYKGAFFGKNTEADL